MSIKLFDYQLKCVDFIKNNFGLILYHFMGGGKTITSLSMAIQFEYPIIIICTKSSQKNFYDDINKIKKLGILNFNANLSNLNDINIITYKKAISLILNKPNIFTNNTIIVDEAHHLRSQTKLTSLLISSLEYSKKLILLTGTLFYNSPIDICPLVNLIKKVNVLPLTSKEFYFYYYDENYDIVTNTELFKAAIKNTISYYKPDFEKDSNYPKYSIEYNSVDMSNEQISEYRFFIKKILSLHDIQHIDYSIIDKRKMNNFLTVTRQLSNTVNKSPDSPKFKAMFNYIKKYKMQTIVYSNFIDYGILPLSVLLKNDNISYRIFYGEQNESQRSNIIDDYNKGIFQVLLITSVGSESLDLKNTRFIHIMEPHWNDSKINQIIGRSIRYGSHSQLPINERNVKIIYWYSVFGYKIVYESSDEYLIDLAKKKRVIFNQFDELIKSCSI
jgi:superfamily II DNA or RNA helicase